MAVPFLRDQRCRDALSVCTYDAIVMKSSRALNGDIYLLIGSFIMLSPLSFVSEPP